MNATATSLDIPHLSFDSGLPGFPEAKTFVLLHTELAREPFSIMRCIEDPELEFVVVTPVLFFPEYAPEIDDATAERLGIKSPDDALLLVILSVGDEAIDITANLMGPIVINRHSNQAAQAILVHQEFSVTEPLFSEEVRSAARGE